MRSVLLSWHAMLPSDLVIWGTPEQHLKRDTRKRHKILEHEKDTKDQRTKIKKT